MFRASVCLALLILAALPLPCPAAAPPTALPSEIARWVNELADDTFAVRVAASQKLRLAGEPAEAALEKAARSTDAEVARRAKEILADFHWGIYPGTPEAVVSLIRGYQAAARSEKRPIIQKLLAAGTPGCRALIKIAKVEDDPLVRKEVFSDISATLARNAPALLEEGNRAALESLLELALAGDVRSGVGHYAAYHLLTGKLPARIAEWETRAKKAVVPKAEMEVLAFLYRAAGNIKKARRAAIDAERNDVLEGMLYEMADWKELAKLPELSASAYWPSLTSYRAAYARLAGDRKLFDDAIKDLLERAGPIAQASGNVLPFAKGLFLNGKPTEALDLLTKASANTRMRYEIHAARLEIKAAFALVEAARKAASPELADLEILQARTLHQLGEKEQALAILKRYTGQIRPGIEAIWYSDLVEVELGIGRVEEAFAATAKIIAATKDPGWAGRLFDKLFGERLAADALALWALLERADRKESTEMRLASLRALMEGKATADRIKTLLAASSVRFGDSVHPLVLAEQRRALGETALACKREELAIDCFRQAESVRATLRLGDLLAKKKNWPGAAVKYLEAYRKALLPTPPGDMRTPDETGENLPALALYLHGHALEQAGRTAEGKARIEQAHLLPLGDGEMRYYLSKALQRRGQEVAAHREQALLRLLGDPVLSEPGAYYTGEGLRAAAIDAAGRKDYLRAADGYEQAFLRCLNPSIQFSRPVAYVTVPGHIYRMRARGLVKAGRLDEAKVEIERARGMVPGNLELALAVVPELDRRKQTKDADALFRAVLAPHDAITREYPKAAWAHNQMAWLSACCRRDLEGGLKHARTAVSLVPKSPAYHDTLAEVLFQMGKKSDAIAAQKKAIELDPKRTYFRKQLKRLEAGDPRAPRPSEDDE